MARDPIIPPMNISPEELAHRLLTMPPAEDKKVRKTLRKRRSPKAGKVARGQQSGHGT